MESHNFKNLDWRKASTSQYTESEVDSNSKCEEWKALIANPVTQLELFERRRLGRLGRRGGTRRNEVLVLSFSFWERFGCLSPLSRRTQI
jgi:hypothetical protein